MKKIIEGLKEIKQTRKFKISVYIILSVLILLFVFQIGMFVGFKKASFSFRTGENYFREMTGRRNDPMMGLRRGDFNNAHGAVGQIVSINLPNISVENQDENVQTIAISTSTAIRGLTGPINSADLKINDLVVIFGAPDNNSAVIDARLIRLMPVPQDQTLIPLPR